MRPFLTRIWKDLERCWLILEGHPLEEFTPFKSRKEGGAATSADLTPGNQPGVDQLAHALDRTCPSCATISPFHSNLKPDPCTGFKPFHFYLSSPSENEALLPDTGGLKSSYPPRLPPHTRLRRRDPVLPPMQHTHHTVISHPDAPLPVSTPGKLVKSKAILLHRNILMSRNRVKWVAQATTWFRSLPFALGGSRSRRVLARSPGIGGCDADVAEVARQHLFVFAVGRSVVAGAQVFYDLEVPEEHLAAFITRNEDGMSA
jgi:hypothetical protein